MRVLITGGSGFIGTNLVEHYLTAGHEVLSADLVPPRNADHARVWRQLDVRDAGSVRQVFDQYRPTHVCHLAARTDLHGRTLRDYSANIDGVQAVLDAVAQVGTVQRTVFASSRMVCDIAQPPEHDLDYSPPNAYGRSKVIGEQLVRSSDSGPPWVMVRPTSIWGPWFGTPYREFFVSVARRRYVQPRGRNPRKSFGFVGNVVIAVDRLIQSTDPSVDRRTLYLADYEPIELRTFAELIAREAGTTIRTLPLVTLRPVALAGDLLQMLGAMPEPPLTTFRLSNLLTDMQFDMAPLRRYVGELPYSLAEGVQQTVAFLRRQGAI